MQTQFKRLISAVLALIMVLAWYVPSTVSAEGATSETLFGESFDLGAGFAFTGWSGAAGGKGIAKSVSDQNISVGVKDDNGNSVLHVNRPTTAATANSKYNVDARFPATAGWADNSTFMDSYRDKTIVYEFKFKPVQSLSFQVILRGRHDTDGDGTYSTVTPSLFSIKTNGEVKAFGTVLNQAFESGTWYKIALQCNFTNGSGVLYINGTEVEGTFTIPSYTQLSHSATNLNPLLRFTDLGNTTDNVVEYYLDDIAVYTGDVRVEQPDEPEQPTQTVHFMQNFAGEDYTTTAGDGLLIYQGGDWPGTVTRENESDGNHALNVTSPANTGTNNAYQINARYTPTGVWGGDNAATALGDVCGKTLIYQFMIKINTNASVYMMMRTNPGGTKTIIKIQDNVLKSNGNSTIATLDDCKWYSIAVALVFPDNGTGNIQCHVYLDEEYKGNYSFSVGSNDLTQTNYMVRFSNVSSTKASDFMLDNIAVYEAAKVDNAIFGGSFTTNSVTLNAKLGVNFYTTTSGTVKVSNTTSGTEPVVATSADAADSDGDWKHTVRVLPQYMMNEMTAGLYGADGELIAVDTFKLSDYVSDVKANYSAWADLADKLQQYCTAAAIKEGKYTDNNFSVSAVSPNLDAYADTLIDGVKTQVVLDDACDLKIWIPAEYADAMLTVDGKEIGVVKDECALDESDNTYGYAVAKELLPQSYDKQYQVTVGEHSCQISVLGWMQRYIPNNTTATSTNQLAWALYEYYVAAEAMAS